MKIYLTFILAICSILLFGQEEFTVLATKGNVEVLKNGTGAGVKVFSGTKVMPNDAIKLSAGGYVGLVHKSKNAIELTQEGTYAATDLAKKATNTDVASKVMNYVADGMVKKSSVQNKTNVGAIDRAGDEKVHLANPVEDYLLSTNTIFKWLSFEENGEKTNEYIFLIYAGKNILYQEVVKDTVLKLDLAKLNVEANKTYLWSVSPKQDLSNIKKQMLSNESNLGKVHVLDSKKANAIQDTANMVLKNGQITAIQAVMLANYYEQHNINHLAMEMYQKAITLASGVEMYQKMHAEFLCKPQVGLNHIASKLYPNMFSKK
jgi:hypothetical protein